MVIQENTSEHGSTPPQAPRIVFHLDRIPASLRRFRGPPSEYDPNPARTRWFFAKDAIISQPHNGHFSWSHTVKRVAEQRRFMDLHMRNLVDSKYWSCPKKPALNEDEQKELSNLQGKLAPADCSLYGSLVELELQRMVNFFVSLSEEINHTLSMV